MKHTPGPWEAFDPGDYSDYDGKCSVVLGDGMKVRIAVALGTRPEDIANARLISAAPDLLEALITLRQMLIEWHNDYPSHVGCAEPEAIGKAKVAIAKATGEQQ